MAFLQQTTVYNAQDTLRKFEFGSTIITVNSLNTKYYYPYDKPSFQFVNGLFFRYIKKRIGIRANVSYSENAASYASPIYIADGGSGDIENKDFIIGLGGQFSILKRKDWFYTFVDVSYRNIFSTGHYNGGIAGANDKFSKTSNGYDTFFGLGFKIKTIKNMYLSPELGFNSNMKFVNQTTISMNSGKTSHFNSNDFNFNPQLKMHLTVKF